jgi:diguanylate cyclase (GGDEF)-like protein/PAS domain S-box-containing protein
MGLTISLFRHSSIWLNSAARYLPGKSHPEVPACLMASVGGWNWALICVLLVLLVAQQVWIFMARWSSAKRDELFRIITENAADMIALVDMKRKRLYNSPAYKRVLGYSPAELSETTSFEQIHQDDRFKVLEAARQARETGVGKTLQYRMRHRNGSWRILESTASVIRDKQGEVDKLVIVNRDITDRKRVEEQLEYNSLHDALTGLPNRRRFLERLQHCFQQGQRNPEVRYAVLFVAMDDFKSLNDAMGPHVAEQLIIESGRRLSECLRDHDTVAGPHGGVSLTDALLSRLEGDEFPILLEGLKDPSDAMRVATRVQAAMATPLLLEGREVSVSVAIGIVLSTTPHGQAEDLLRDADMAMRRARALGRGRCEMFDVSMHARAMHRLTMEAGLRRAIEHHEFGIHYQPIVNLDTRRTIALEGLLRWRRADGLISPYEFIDVAEETGLIVPIGQPTIAEACRQIRAWQSKYATNPPLQLTIKISARQFTHPKFVRDIKATLRETRIEPGTLNLEMTEGVAMLEPKLTAELFSQLKLLGIRIIIDHFWTGHMPLASLLRLPIDGLKVDRSLISTVLSDRGASEILSLILTVARKLKVDVIAEGIEGILQVEHLRRLGCEFGQGYFFGKPMEASLAEAGLAQPGLAKAASINGSDHLKTPTQ